MLPIWEWTDPEEPEYECECGKSGILDYFDVSDLEPEEPEEPPFDESLILREVSYRIWIVDFRGCSDELRLRALNEGYAPAMPIIDHVEEGMAFDSFGDEILQFGLSRFIHFLLIDRLENLDLPAPAPNL